MADNVLQLQSKLVDSHETLPEEWRYRKRRRLNPNEFVEGSEELDESANSKVTRPITIDSLWDELNDDWMDMLPFCSQTLDAWDRKMKLVETYDVRKEKMKRKTHSISERIAMILEHPQRILGKMQSVDKLFKMYGDRKSGTIEDNNQDGDDIEEKDARIRAGLEDDDRLKFENVRIECEVFNDSEFYRRMLKEIIDIGQAVGNIDHQAIRDKMDKVRAERRAARDEEQKARIKLKYAIRPDMENFMAPIYDHDADFPVEQLYNSLFQ